MSWLTSVNEPVDSAKSRLIASHRVRVKSHRQRLPRRIELFHGQSRDVAAEFVAPRRRRRQLVSRINVQVQTQVVGAPVHHSPARVIRDQRTERGAC